MSCCQHVYSLTRIIIGDVYGNIKGEGSVLETEVKGIRIMLNATSLGRILKAPTIESDEIVNKETTLKTILGIVDVVNFEEILASKLSVDSNYYII